jgi:hypothetical protein
MPAATRAMDVTTFERLCADVDAIRKKKAAEAAKDDGAGGGGGVRVR